MAENMSSGYPPGYDFSEDPELLGDSIDKADGFNFDDFVNDPSAGGHSDETSPGGGSPDSFSDSSSKRAKSISSTKTSFPGDQMNADGLGFKSEWPEDTMLSQDPLNPTVNGGTVSLAAMERTNITNPMLLDTSPLLNNTMFNAGVQAPKQTMAQNDHLKMNFDFNFGRGDNAYFSPQHLDMSMNDRSREVSPTSGSMSNACSPHTAHSMGYGFSGLPNLTPNMGPSWVAQQPMSAMPLGSPYPGLTPHIRFAIVPPLGTLPPKSRVETQIQIRMMICPLPPNIKTLHLPTYSIAKPKLLAKPSPPEPRADMYELQTVLVCSSAMVKPEVKDAALARARKAAQLAQFRRLGREATEQPDEEPLAQDGGSVVICGNCISREKKRSQRKKNKKAEEEEIWVKNEDRRVVVFNTQEVREWTVPQPVSHSPADYGLHAVDVPMRIACYCRHHHEKVGFQVIFTLMDYNANIIAQSVSPSIMITDDHKTPGTNALAESQAMAPLSPTEAFRGPVNDQQGQRRSTSVGAMPPVTPISQMQERLPTPLTRPPSPTGVPHPKKRKSSSTPKMHNALSMTPLEPAVAPGMQFHGLQLTQPSATSPLASTSQSFGALGFSEGMGGAPSMAHTFTSSPSSAGDEEQIRSNVITPFMENMNAPPTLSAPPSGPVSRAPSPGMARRQMEEQIMGTFSQLYATAPPPESPFIHTIIPPEGPKGGGIEVSIFGNNIPRDVTVMFGEAEAIAVTHWGPKAITCILPPANGAFTVPVSLKQGGQRHFQREAKFFRYIDNDEDRLLRQFVAVVTGQFTGQSSDVVELTKNFIQSIWSGQGGAGFPSWGTGDGGAEGSGAGNPRSQGSRTTLEPQLLKLLEFIDLEGLEDLKGSPRKPMFKDPTDQTGQTMMHLACSLGFSRLVAGLIARGANSDIRDRGGYTPLHFAALNGHGEIIPRLISSGADPAMRSLNGLTAADMASSDDIIKYLRHVGGHRRTRSRVSLPSAGSSIASLNLLWEPLSRLERAAGVDPLPDEESPEYSSSEDADTASDSEELWLKANSGNVYDFHPQDVPDVPQEPDIPKATSSPTLKDQFAAQWQQFHQSMVQNLPQFRQFPQLSQLPYMPQFPNMPQLSQLPYLPQLPNVHLLPEYQAAMLQRIAAIIPARGYRSGSTGSQTSGKEVDSSPPPAYEEIFPQKQSSAADIKQESAARAALEAEADSKCAALFETQADETESSHSVETTDSVGEDSQTLPMLLQIGRKNAITKQQQEDLRRAHAARLKGLSGDMNLFFIWIPLLLLVSAAMFYGTMQGMFSAAMVYFAAMVSLARDEMQQLVKSGQERALGDVK